MQSLPSQKAIALAEIKEADTLLAKYLGPTHPIRLQLKEFAKRVEASQ